MTKLFSPMSEFQNPKDKQLVYNYYKFLRGLVPENTDFQFQNSSLQNYFVNGSLLVWQEKTSYTISSGTGATFLADYWRFVRKGGNNWAGTISRSSTIPNGSSLPYSMLISTTSNTSVTIAGTCSAVEIMMPTWRSNLFGNKKFWMSFWLRCNQAGVLFLYLQDSGRLTSYIIPCKIDIANQFQQFRFLVDLTQPNALVPFFSENTTSANVRVGFVFSGRVPGTGVQRQIWTSDDVRLSDDITDTKITDASTLYIHDFRVTTYPGLVETRSFEEELVLCKRIYQKSFDYGQAPVQNLGSNTGEIRYRIIVGGAIQSSVDVKFPVEMCFAPTITYFNPNNNNTNWYNNAIGADSGASTTANNTTKGFHARNAGVAGDSSNNLCLIHYVADARIL